MFCLKIPENFPTLGGCFLMNRLASCPVFFDTLEKAKDFAGEEFWGFEIVEIDSLENRHIIKSHGIIPNPVNLEEN